ncbi:HD domain-containing protein [bacterium]|nr:HD domain-containing protein [bacterium]
MAESGEQAQISASAAAQQQLARLLEVSRLIAGRLELRPLIHEVIEQASHLVQAQRSTLWLHDPDRDDLYTFIGEGLSQEFRVPLDRGVVGAAARQRRSISIEDAYHSELFNPEIDRFTGYRTHSIVAVPMQTQRGALLGVFQSINRIDAAAAEGVGVFTAADIELLEAMAGFVAVAIENAQLYEEQKRQFNSLLITLASSVDARDPTTSKHTMYVTGIAVAIARELGLSDARIERIRIAAILHDYGKIGVPDEVLLKPGGLERHEVRRMRSHVLKTGLILSRIAFRRDLADVPAIAAMHHEKLDGSGYPFGLRGEEIPLEGRILAVADVFHALTQTRTYKKGKSPQEALEECESLTQAHIDRYGRESGAHLDANCVAALGRVLLACGDDMNFFEQASGWQQMLDGGG